MVFFSITDDLESQVKYTDAELISLARTKPWLFSELVVRYEAPFLRRALRIIHNPAEAEEIVQDTFTKIYLHSDSFVEQAGAQFSSWAYRILLNTAFTYYQKRVKEGVRYTILDPEFESLVADTSDLTTQREASDAIARILQILPSHFAQVLRLHYLERWSQQAIAEHTGDTVGAIKVRIHRAKQAYRQEQARLGEDPVL